MPQLGKNLRLLHILGGPYLGAFLFSPLIESTAATALARIVSIGLLVSGLAMWQWNREQVVSRDASLSPANISGKSFGPRRRLVKPCGALTASSRARRRS
jgi:hypothetical protein